MSENTIESRGRVGNRREIARFVAASLCATSGCLLLVSAVWFWATTIGGTAAKVTFIFTPWVGVGLFVLVWKRMAPPRIIYIDGHRLYTAFAAMALVVIALYAPVALIPNGAHRPHHPGALFDTPILVALVLLWRSAKLGSDLAWWETGSVAPRVRLIILSALKAGAGEIHFVPELSKYSAGGVNRAINVVVGDETRRVGEIPFYEEKELRHLFDRLRDEGFDHAPTPLSDGVLTTIRGKCYELHFVSEQEKLGERIIIRALCIAPTPAIEQGTPDRAEPPATFHDVLILLLALLVAASVITLLGFQLYMLGLHPVLKLRWILMLLPPLSPGIVLYAWDKLGVPRILPLFRWRFYTAIPGVLLVCGTFVVVCVAMQRGGSIPHFALVFAAALTLSTQSVLWPGYGPAALAPAWWESNDVGRRLRVHLLEAVQKGATAIRLVPEMSKYSTGGVNRAVSIIVRGEPQRIGTFRFYEERDLQQAIGMLRTKGLGSASTPLDDGVRTLIRRQPYELHITTTQETLGERIEIAIEPVKDGH